MKKYSEFFFYVEVMFAFSIVGFLITMIIVYESLLLAIMTFLVNLVIVAILVSTDKKEVPKEFLETRVDELSKKLDKGIVDNDVEFFECLMDLDDRLKKLEGKK